MIFFDDALPTLVEHCEQADRRWGNKVSRFAVLRDHQGKLHLVLLAQDRSSLASQDVHELQETLKGALGGYFAPPILFPSDVDEDRRRLAIQLGKQCDQIFKPWEDVPAFRVRESGEEIIPSPGRWFKLERRLSKRDWLDSSLSPPWPATSGTPFIASFYSFKGGVGRTTALLSCACQLAEKGVPVAVIDLDLEAPGLGGLLGARAQRGVLDFLVEYLVHDRSDSLDDYAAPAAALGEEQARLVTVYPAGELRASFLEKLGRLDFLGRSEEDQPSPVGKALRALLEAIKNRPPQGFARPQYIFIDSRAGLHDLAGLALHGLAHLDVLCARATEQSLAGLDLTVCMLGRRPQRKLAKRDLPPCLVVHTMVDPATREQESEQFVQRSYAIFKEHIYKNAVADGVIPEVPGLKAERKERGEISVHASPHEPEVLLRSNFLERFDELTPDVRNALSAPSYQRLLARIEERKPQP